MKFLRSLPSEWKTHTLIWRNKADLEEQSLDDLLNNLNIYEAKFKSLSPTSHNTQNIAFVFSNNTDNTNESVSVIPSVSAASSKALVSTLPNVDNLSDAVIYSFFATEKERDELKLTLEKFQTSSKNLSKLLESQITDKTSLGYDSQVFNSDELNSYESDDSVPTSLVNDRYKTCEGYHVVPPPYTGTFMPPKPDLVFHDAPPTSETVPNMVYVESSTNKTSKEMSKTFRPDAPIIEDWTSNSKDESEPEESVKIVEHPKQAKNLRTTNQKSRGHQHSWNRKACFVCKSLNHLIKDCDYYEKKMVQKPMWNHEIRVNHQNSARITHPYFNRHVVLTAVLTRSRLVPLNTTRPVYTAIPQPTVKRSPRTIKHVVHKEHSAIKRPINHRPTTKHSSFHQKVTTVKVTKGNPQQALKDKGYVAFGGNPKGGKVIGKGNQPRHSACIKENLDAGKVGKETESAQQYVLLPLWSTGSQDPHNTYANASFDVKENENEVHVSPRVRDLRDEFKESFVNSTNRVNAASAPVTAVRLNPPNSTDM
uniref:Ribonuclease H-like domain-containing protein n=1 Tax=Tanacetum cinerariifolium TaxID=118510 RepID=A0A6L2MPV9_TANCI|nr:ribonuclease H-like domain-containing protein [Tanacetum cinerariifolium]